MANLSFNTGTSPEFTYIGTSSINLSDYNDKLFAVYRKEEEGTNSSYIPGSQLNLKFTTLEPGRVYSIWAKEPFTIVY